MTARIPLPDRVSGQSILNALKFAGSCPGSEKFKWLQHEASSTFHLFERRSNRTSRQRVSLPKYSWNEVPGVSMIIVHEGLPLAPDQVYMGEVLLELRIDARSRGVVAAPYKEVVRLLPDQLAALTIRNPPSEKEADRRMSA